MPKGFTLFAFFSVGLIAAAAQGHAAPEENGPTTPAFVSGAACIECHEEADEAWRDSHHSWALRVPTPENVLGNFNDAVFEHRGVVSRFFQRDDAFFIETDDADGQRATFQIAYTVGVAPLQQYLIGLDGGRLQALDIAWDTLEKRWFHVFPELNPSDRGLHWTGPYKNWQARCAECHQTNFVKEYDPSSMTYDSRWSELTVGCETCHGPGQAHVNWAKNPENYDLRQFTGIDNQGLAIVFDEKDAEGEIQVCASCHSRREPLDADSPPPGKPYADHHVLSMLRDGLYHADGQIDGEVYVYGSFLQSKMYEKGVRCTNCHDPHGGNLIAEGDALCLQCHSPAGNPDFPTLALVDYGAVEHHRHLPDTEAAQCVSCHMPEKKYMVVDPRRDHSFRVPRPDISAAFGTPDACTGCHDDKTMEWAAEQVERWFPDGRTGQPHFVETIAQGHRGDNSAKARDALISLARDSEVPAIIRATALNLSRPATEPEVIDRLLPLLSDPSDLVRREAIRLFRAASTERRIQTIGPLLSDPLRSVRIAAARELLNIPPSQFAPRLRVEIGAAAREYQQSLLARTDYPEVQFTIAGMALTLRNFDAAERAFAMAVRMDPQATEGWMMIARLRAARGDREGATKALRDGLAANPRDAELKDLLLDLRGQERQNR